MSRWEVPAVAIAVALFAIAVTAPHRDVADTYGAWLRAPPPNVPIPGARP